MSLKFTLPCPPEEQQHINLARSAVDTRAGGGGQSEARVNLSPLTQTLARSWTQSYTARGLSPTAKAGTHITKGKAGTTTEDKGYLRKRSAAVVENMNHPAQCPLRTCRVNIPHLYSNDSHRTGGLHYSGLAQ